MSYVDLNGLFVLECRVTVPAAGAWVADVSLPDETDVQNPCTLTIGNLTLRGTIVRTEAFAGARTVRIVGGAGGWGRKVSPRAYQDPVGIRRSLVLADLAAETGETIAPTAEIILGLDFVRESASASRILRQLVGPLWWIDAAGVTHVEPRPSATVKTPFQVVSYDGGRGRLLIATEDLASWVPGAVIQNDFVQDAITAASVTYAVDRDGELRVEVLAQESATGASTDRMMKAIRDIVRAEIFDLRFYGLWEYQVTSANVVNGRSVFDGYSLNADMPPIVGVALAPGIPGLQARPTPGSTILVGFVNANPLRPVVLAYDATPAPTTAVAGGVPVVLAESDEPVLLGQETGRVVRYGDLIAVPVVGSLASGPLMQLASSAPNQISKVRA